MTTRRWQIPGAADIEQDRLAFFREKASNTGPDSHSGKHKAPVPGAFGNDETREYDATG